MKPAGPVPVARALHKLWRYWQELQVRQTPGTQAPSIPAKTTLRLGGLGTVLPNIVLSEWLDEDKIIIRLAGTMVEEMTGQALAGVNLLDLTPATQRHDIGRVYTNLFTVPCGFHISESIRVGDGKKYTLAALVLPLADADGAACFAIGQYALSRNGFEENRFEAASIIEHRQIDMFGYIDVGHGLPPGATAS